MLFLKRAKFIKTFVSNLKPITSVRIRKIHNSEDNTEDILKSDSAYNNLIDSHFHLKHSHRCLIIQPYVKWGPQKLPITPEEQLEEAVALVQTLPSWLVEDTITVPLDTLDKKTLFKSGSMEKLKDMINKNASITSVFINLGNLKRITTSILEENFQVPVLDRYKIVMQILKLHATSKHAKLQVALAELYYLQRKAQQSAMFKTSDSETLKMMFQTREQKLKTAIGELRNQRSLLRKKRQRLNYPVVAVVGYTNSGKTSLIKALTREENLQPKNQLFATLDVTTHSGYLPSGLEVLYVDTVGFISDIPTNLIECFVATLEDAVLADIILHVEDVSSTCYEYKRNHVLATLKKLGVNKEIMKKVITVGNKCDVVNCINYTNGMLVSAKNEIGLNELRRKIEEEIMRLTDRQKITIKVPNGGDEIRWLYKNATVISENPDPENTQFVFASVIITSSDLRKFKHNFI